MYINFFIGEKLFQNSVPLKNYVHQAFINMSKKNMIK